MRRMPGGSSAWTKRSGRQVTVRLIKGAYWDSEVVHAERMGWPVPVWRDKRATDACFERMTDLLLAAAPRRPGDGGVRLAIGSHNVRSIAHGLALTRRYDLPETAIEIQMLYGMADSLKAAGNPTRLARAAVRSDRGDDSRHGLPRPPAPGEHLEPVLAPGGLLWQRA